MAKWRQIVGRVKKGLKWGEILFQIMGSWGGELLIALTQYIVSPPCLTLFVHRADLLDIFLKGCVTVSCTQGLFFFVGGVFLS